MHNLQKNTKGNEKSPIQNWVSSEIPSNKEPHLFHSLSILSSLKWIGVHGVDWRIKDVRRALWSPNGVLQK